MKTESAVLLEYKKPLVIEELELDAPKDREVLIEMKAAGLCHSDYSIIQGKFSMPPLPCIPGHEGAGVVKEVGPNVTRVKPGDHVIVLWVPVCGQCYYCLRGHHHLCAEKDKVRAGTMLDGTHRIRKGDQNINVMMGVGVFSRYNVMSELSVVPVDKDVPFDSACIVGCAVITGVGAVLNRAKIRAGSTVAVVGVGGIGLNIIQGAVLGNASKIIAIDILDNKLEFAKQFGATHVINAAKEDPIEAVLKLTNNIGVDYSFEALGRSETTFTAFKLIRRGGQAVIAGIPALDDGLMLPLFEVSLMEKSIIGTYCGSGDGRIETINLVNLYKNKRLKLDELITKRYRFEEINTGFEDLASGKNARGVIIF